MKKFVLISFGFLGWAFYEMSGGAEFEPASVRYADVIAQTKQAQPLTPTEQPVVTAQAPTIVDTDPPLSQTQATEVTRVALNLNALEEALADAPETEDASAAQTDDAPFGVPRNVDSLSGNAPTPAIIPSLIVPSSQTEQVAVTQTASTADVRTVSGSRVNVRGGPSTDFEIVTRLLRGDAVEILEDNGDGWVRMRPTDGGPEGWMADFLLVAN